VSESMAGEEVFLNHVLYVMSRVSIGDLSIRVKIPNTMDSESIGYRLATGLNILISDLEDQAHNRVRALAEEAIAKSEEVKMVVESTQELISEFREYMAWKKGLDSNIEPC
jgi:hypothetical protein